MAFSSSMMLADLDYIAPAQACIKPSVLAQQKEFAEKARGRVGLHVDGVEAPPPAKDIIKISLQDCLACSGCVTTAETVLITSQSRPELERVVGVRPPVLVVSISDASASSLAAHWGCDAETAFLVVSGFARATWGATHVVDLRWAHQASLDETATEYVQRLTAPAVEGAPAALPLLVSSCPGWVCYAEKTHPTLLPLVCPVMSAQAIAGLYIKEHVAAAVTGSIPTPTEEDPDSAVPRAYHVSIQPCFDRKLEAARPDLDSAVSGRGTDCVLSTHELLEWMNEIDATVPWRAPLDSQLAALRAPAPDCDATTLEGSGGYHQHVMRVAAAALAAVAADEDDDGARPELALEEIAYQTKRNNNHRLASHAALVAGGKRIVFGVAYGFQHIQNVVRGLKRRTAATPNYSFVEVMACPEGCLHGGGQARVSEDVVARRELLAKTATVFQRFSTARSAAGGGGGDAFTTESIYRDWLRLPSGSADAHARLCTIFHDRQAEMAAMGSAAVVASLKW
jgi:iron only hydrogenase large subunit-like protein